MWIKKQKARIKVEIKESTVIAIGAGATVTPKAQTIYQGSAGKKDDQVYTNNKDGTNEYVLLVRPLLQ